MNYLIWNNAIIKHFFNPENEEKEVMLYFSETIIEEIGENNFPMPDEGYIEDFYKALRLGVSGIINDDYIQRILNLEQKYNSGCRNINGINIEYPPYFSYLLAFILPFTSGDALEEYNMNNFHDIVNIFFERKMLSKNYNTRIKNSLIKIDSLWIRINDWLKIEKKIGYLEEIKPPAERKYVGKFEYHILFRKEQEERLSMLFDEKDILPGGVLSEYEIRNLLVNNYQKLKISSNTKNRINDTKDYIGSKIVKRVLTYYNNWNGINHTVEGQRGFSRNKLVLCLDFNSLSNKINFKYLRIFSENGIPENLQLENRNKGSKILEEKIYQINSYYSNPITNCFKDLNTEIQLVDNSSRNKYSWKAKELFLFKKISNFDWVEISKVESSIGKTLIVCKKEFFRSQLYNWFDNIANLKKIYDDNIKTNLPIEWMALTVDAITNSPHQLIHELIPNPEQKPKINFDKSFYIDGKLFRNKLPLVWLENSESCNSIIAKYEDDSEIPLTQETNDEDGEKVFVNQFRFNSAHASNLNLNKHFKLVSGEISSHRLFEISDFQKRNNDEIEKFLPKREGFGQISDITENYIKGLEHFYTNRKIISLKPFQECLNNVFINKIDISTYHNNSEYDLKHFGNILIQYMSEKDHLSKKEFENCVFSLLAESFYDLETSNPAAQLGYLLQDLGYVDYNSEKGLYCINKPQLIVIPSERGTTFKLIGAVDIVLIKGILNFCRQHSNFTLNIQTDSKNILIPQAIFLQLRQTRHELIVPLVKQFNILFKKSDLFTQFALTSSFPDIDKWQDFINETKESDIQNIEGGYIFDIETLKFINKPNDFIKLLAFIKFTNINGYKTIYRLWYGGICYNIPDQQLGIYLYLFLFKEIACNKFNQCVNTKGLFNCEKEKEQKDTSQKMTNILVFDSVRKLLAVPLYCKLPRYFSMSFQLMSGQLPVIRKFKFDGVRYCGPYFIYQNIPRLFLENNLNSKLLKRTPQNPIFDKEIIL